MVITTYIHPGLHFLQLIALISIYSIPLYSTQMNRPLKEHHIHVNVLLSWVNGIGYAGLPMDRIEPWVPV